MELRALFLGPFTLLRLAAILHQAASQSQCLTPDGHININPDFVPCPNSSVCCALNRPNVPGGDVKDGGTRDECLPSGLCENRGVRNGVAVQTWWRNFCVEGAQWNNIDCPASDPGNIQMTPCDGTRDSEKWCCGETTDCCTEDGGVRAIVLAPTLGQPLPARETSTASILPSVAVSSTSSALISSSTSGTATPTTDAFPTSGDSDTPTASPNPTSSSTAPENSLSTGAKAGIGAGAGVGAIILIALGFFIAKALSWKRAATERNLDNWEAATAQTGPSFGSPPSGWDHMAAHPATWPPRELDTAGDPRELAGTLPSNKLNEHVEARSIKPSGEDAVSRYS
ncbi:hypothetical protein M011DRAFT_462947 [Sporormia fimetaria CBS 119925]|uniref:Mid2 domain-containing protein n=1 Tax=Sporormia fimetaria CBS 119925 TaxID=1340428 RepID=A0A6A6UWH8_9PLEO|nr:hypothetical protein M011DRAFT_462947 [Sporormia fimetaria CBS 119925]